MNIRVVLRGELSEKQEVMKNADERPECDSSNARYYTDQDGEKPQGGRIKRPRFYRS